LGIARRKAGTVVRCPTCAGQVVVPSTDGGEDPKAGTERPLFERSDFDELFNNPVPAAEDPSDARTAGREAAQGTGSASGTAAPPAPAHGEAWGTHADPDVAVEPTDVPRGGVPAFQPQPRAPGIVLSPAKATILTVVVVIGLAVAFAAGLLVGRFLLTAS
jgi:hypothetical protein